ncbi:ribonuclease HI family protein [Candidatus Uhrbacteria bacterium]|nr:ribonuclease HI family protein [Candidatus Uhrbacteria bacterium]
MKYITFTDGGARGNPGPAAIGGVVIEKNSNKKISFHQYIGNTTNNQAEYKALIHAMKTAIECGASEIECFLDSELIVKQLNREYRVKDKDLGQLFLAVWNLSARLKKISFHHIRREKNKEADALVNYALDERKY